MLTVPTQSCEILCQPLEQHWPPTRAAGTGYSMMLRFHFLGHLSIEEPASACMLRVRGIWAFALLPVDADAWSFCIGASRQGLLAMWHAAQILICLDPYIALFVSSLNYLLFILCGIVHISFCVDKKALNQYTTTTQMWIWWHYSSSVKKREIPFSPICFDYLNCILCINV
jgi:hypothetical protein